MFDLYLSSLIKYARNARKFHINDTFTVTHIFNNVMISLNCNILKIISSFFFDSLWWGRVLFNHKSLKFSYESHVSHSGSILGSILYSTIPCVLRQIPSLILELTPLAKLVALRYSIASSRVTEVSPH